MSDCPWPGWGSRAAAAATWGQAGAAGRCGSGSGPRRAGGGFAGPGAQPAGCAERTLSLPSAGEKQPV